MNLLRGQRANLFDLFSHNRPFTIKIVVNAPNLIIDFSCFGLDITNKLPDDRYMAFFNQPKTPCGSVRFKYSDQNTAAFIIDLQKLPTHIDRLVITAAIDGDGAMSQLISGAVTLRHSNIEVATFTFAGDDFKAEKALMLMEIYRKEGNWRIWAVGQGFNGGLDTLVQYFGGAIDEPLAITHSSVEQLSNPPAKIFLKRIFKQIFKERNASEASINTVETETLSLLSIQSSKSTNENIYPALTRKVSQRLTEIDKDAMVSSRQDASNLNSYWKPQGTSVKISDVVIEGGFLYFGSGLTSMNGSPPEPALIDPKLPISHIASANYQPIVPYYWTSYSGASPDTRAAYIKWLVNGRNDPSAHIGYVILYFYGLERRALADAKTDIAAKIELPKIIQEVERLLEVYHHNNSFRSYATGLLDLLNLDCVESFVPKQYLASPPDFIPGILPISLKLVLGQLAMDKEPVPANWAYAWFIAESRTRPSTPAKRYPVEFKKLFITKYHESFGFGILLPVNKTKIKASYTTVNTSFPSRTIERKSDIPDVTILTSRINKLQVLADQCTETLNTYSRLLGRNPELEGTLDALLELPYLLWPEQQKKHFQALKHTLETTKTPVVIEFSQLKAWLPEWQTITKTKVAAFINRLAEAGLGMEPDTRFGGTMPNSDSKVVLFIDEGLFIVPTPRYTTAALTLHLAVVVSLANGEVGNAERDLLIQQIEDWLHLEVVEKNRLHAHLRWLLAEPPDFKTIKKRVEPLPVSARQVLADFLVLIAYADNKISPNEVKVLEKIYKSLNLDVQSLYGKLHGTSTDEPVTVRTSLPTSIGFSIPNPPQPNLGFQLDMNRVAALKNESKKVTDMLVAIFEQDIVPDTLIPIQIQTNDHENLLGLDNAHSDLIKLLCTRIQWSRTELEEIAADSDMMLDGALEHINEAAYDSFDEPFTEGDDPIKINQDILKELLFDNDTSER